MSTKSCPSFYGELLHKNGQDFCTNCRSEATVPAEWKWNLAALVRQSCGSELRNRLFRMKKDKETADVIFISLNLFLTVYILPTNEFRRYFEFGSECKDKLWIRSGSSTPTKIPDSDHRFSTSSILVPVPFNPADRCSTACIHWN